MQNVESSIIVTYKTSLMTCITFSLTSFIRHISTVSRLKPQEKGAFLLNNKKENLRKLAGKF